MPDQTTSLPAVAHPPTTEAGATLLTHLPADQMSRRQALGIVLRDLVAQQADR